MTVSHTALRGNQEVILAHIAESKEFKAIKERYLKTESAARLGSLNVKISRIRGKLDTIADNRLNVIKKFNADLLNVDEKMI